ncbi:MAG: crossover junction endodeoxyribonuclease RuvC [Hyphomicrobiales bacterium]
MKTNRTILGIDPGTNIMGYGLIRVEGKKMSLINMGIIKLGGYEGHPAKLKKIFERTLHLVDEYQPDEVALEAPFYGKNVQSMLKLGRAQGVAMAAALYRDLTIEEYTPRKIKQSITGSGSASKEQVASMLKTLLNFKEIPEFLDATDGLAVAVCHYFQNANPQAKSYSSWKSFINENPKRVVKK